MNVSSVLKLITPNVSELLVKDYNDETKALVMFLKMLRFIHIHESFENKHENIRDRLKKLSYATIFSRILNNLEIFLHRTLTRASKSTFI